jgi:hypothetical protein
MRRVTLPVIPGAKCPAWRTNRHTDPKVTVDHSATTTHRREGVRTHCGLCGRENVRVHQAHGVHWSAWYYYQHEVPVLTKEKK